MCCCCCSTVLLSDTSVQVVPSDARADGHQSPQKRLLCEKKKKTKRDIGAM